MIDWLTGWQVGWTRKTSFSRTLSRILTKMFSFANWKTSALPGLDAEVAADLPGEVRVRVAVVDLELVRVHGRPPDRGSIATRHAPVRRVRAAAARLGGVIVADGIAAPPAPARKAAIADDAVALVEAHHDDAAGLGRAGG